MGKIKQNSKIFYIVFGAIDVCLLIATVFLLAAALLFRGGSAPALFGHYVFLSETDAFSAVKKGSALIVDPVEPDQIAPGNIIIFTDEQGDDRIGEVQETISDDGIYTFTVRTDIESSVTVGQSHIVGKGMYYSEFIGGVVSFATSPAGVCLIAILPCAAFVIFEIIGIIKRRAPLPEVDTVKKQYETPTYVPPARNAEPDYEDDEDDRPAFSPDRRRLVEAAGLFTPAKKPEPEPAPKPVERAPISGRDIDKLIRETKARHERDSFSSAEKPENRAAGSNEPEQRPSGRAAAVAAYRANKANTANTAHPDERPEIEITPEDERPHEIRKETVEKPRERVEDNVKQYIPPKVKYVPRVNRLDSLLREDTIDSDNDGSLDINDILKNIEAKKK